MVAVGKTEEEDDEATAEDVAGAVTFLASDDAAYVAGTDPLVDVARTSVVQDDTLLYCQNNCYPYC